MGCGLILWAGDGEYLTCAKLPLLPSLHYLEPFLDILSKPSMCRATSQIFRKFRPMLLSLLGSKAIG